MTLDFKESVKFECEGVTYKLLYRDDMAEALVYDANHNKVITTFYCDDIKDRARFIHEVVTTVF